MEKMDLVPGDVVQISPEHNNYPGFLLVVTELKEWGVQGYLLHTEDFFACRFEDKAYLRVRWENMEYVGRLAWIEKTLEEKDDEQ